MARIVVIDDEGLVHVAFGRQIHVDEDPAAGWNYYPYSDGLVYWNETMPTLDTAKLTADIIPEDWESHYLYQNGNLAAWAQPNGNDTIVGIAYYGASMTSMPQLAFYRNDHNIKVIHVNYSAIAVGYDNSELNYRHIWERFTEGDGKFSAFTDHTGDVFHIFSECVYPSVSQNIPNEKISLIYQSDNMPGTSIQPDPPVHDPVLNSIVYLNVGPFIAVGNEEIGVSAPEVTQNYPNPFQGSSWFEVTLRENANINLEVYSLTGQKVMVSDFGHKTAGRHTLPIDATSLSDGIYFYTVTAGHYKSTHKMMIR